eukprot:TRINITY_DN65692_c0_g3_i1.p1 TRINITY_DN65692_c0_g3~~TRINITY_DN65692_c0_g3_i1.p1  ORF type:complete len:259 (-),score=19.36 TRINITY_DN65692_c0_g3_i1:152-928(-)
MMLLTTGFAVLLGFVASAFSNPLSWDAISCAVTLHDCPTDSGSAQVYIPGQCYASYSSDYGGAAWMLSQDCSQVTVVSYGNGSRTGCSVSGGTTYSTINPTACIPGLASGKGKIFATKKSMPAPMVPARYLCHSIVKQYTADTECSSSSWQSTIYSPYPRQLCISFSGATGASKTSADCLSYTLYSTNNCSGTPTEPSANFAQGCNVDGTTASRDSYYGIDLPSSVVPSAPSAIGGASVVFVPATLLLVVTCATALVL